jgi:hypothetical protein
MAGLYRPAGSAPTTAEGAIGGAVMAAGSQFEMSKKRPMLAGDFGPES